MQLPPELGWMDLAFLTTLSVFLLAWVQYWKKSLPDNEMVVKIFSALSSVGISYLLSQVMKLDHPMTILAVILYGFAAAIFSDTGYQFLSSSKSKAFTLPSQAQQKGLVSHIGGPGDNEIITKKEREKEIEISKRKTKLLALHKELDELEKKDKEEPRIS